MGVDGGHHRVVGHDIVNVDRGAVRAQEPDLLPKVALCPRPHGVNCFDGLDVLPPGLRLLVGIPAARGVQSAQRRVRWLGEPNHVVMIKAAHILIHILNCNGPFNEYLGPDGV
jgi:hypothetical protein